MQKAENLLQRLRSLDPLNDFSIWSQNYDVVAIPPEVQCRRDRCPAVLCVNASDDEICREPCEPTVRRRVLLKDAARAASDRVERVDKDELPGCLCRVECGFEIRIRGRIRSNRE